MFNGWNLSIETPCGLACRYCGYMGGTWSPVDLDAVRAHLRGLLQRESANGAADGSRGPEWVRLVGRDPVEHPQFEAIVGAALEVVPRALVQTTGLALAERLRTGDWPLAEDQRVYWELPYLSADAETHDFIVGLPGHHRIIETLLADKRLRVAVNVLLVRAVLPRLAATVARLRELGRKANLRVFTPRETRTLDYYNENCATFAELFGAAREAVDDTTFRRLLAENAECFPVCVVPEPYRDHFREVLAARARPGGVGLQNSGVWTLAPCARAAECRWADSCLGVHRHYVEAHGAGDFVPQPGPRAPRDGVGEAAASLHQRNAVRAALQSGRLREAVRLLGPLHPPRDWERGDVDALREAASAAFAREVQERLATDASDAAADAALLRRAGAEEAARSVELALLHARARRAADAQDWGAVLEVHAATVSAGLDATSLETLARQARVALAFVRFDEALARGAPAQAVETLAEIEALEPEHRDLADARAALRRCCPAMAQSADAQSGLPVLGEPGPGDATPSGPDAERLRLEIAAVLVRATQLPVFLPLFRLTLLGVEAADEAVRLVLGAPAPAAKLRIDLGSAPARRVSVEGTGSDARRLARELSVLAARVEAALAPERLEKARELAAKLQRLSGAPAPRALVRSGAHAHGMVRTGFACNQQCDFCWQSRDWGTHAPARIARWIEDLHAAGARRLVITGGEPTLDPQLLAHVRHARALGFSHVAIETNAVRLAEPGFARALREAGLSEAAVSLHSGSAHVSDRVTRAPGTHAQTVEGIGRLLEADVAVTLHAVLVADTLETLPELPRFVGERFGGSAQLQALVLTYPAEPFERSASARLLVPPTRLRQPLMQALETASAAGVRVDGLDGPNGPPLCAFDADTRWCAYGGVQPPVPFRTRIAACEPCAVKASCPGVRPAVVRLFGPACVEPLARAPSSNRAADPR